MPKLTVKRDICLVFASAVILLPLKWIFAWIIAICIHEAGHYLALRSFGVPVYGVHVGISGVYIETTPVSGMKGITCILAGPLFGLLLLAFAKCFPLLAIFGFLQSVINLLPLYPLDGGRLLLCLLDRYPEHFCHRITQIIERLTLMGVLLLGLYLTFVRLLGIIPFLAALFLILRRKLSCKLYRQRVQYQ